MARRSIRSASLRRVTRLGHKAVFLSDPGFVEVYRGYGFEAYPVNLSEPMPPEQMARFWEDFINGHLPNFYKSAYDQIDNYVQGMLGRDRRQRPLRAARPAWRAGKIRPDVICVDNVILFPAIKQHGVPWVRIVSCSENEIEDPAIPPHLSGCAADDHACHARFRARFNEVIRPLHERFNAFLRRAGREALSARPVLRELALPQSAAVSGVGEVQPLATAARRAIPVPRRLRAQRANPMRSRSSGRSETHRWSTSPSGASAPAT